jgi:hypothetical protein
MPGIDINQLWTPARALPSATPDQKSPVTNVRGGRYGEQYGLSLVPTKHLLADEGSYFMTTSANNPGGGPGTAFSIALGAGFNGYSDTVPMFYLQNNDSKSNPVGKRVYFDYVKIICTTVLTSSTGVRYAIKVDPVARSVSTNYGTFLTPISPNSDVSPQSVCTFWAQNSTTLSALSGSSTSARVVANGSMGNLTVVGDEYAIISGTTDPGVYPGTTAVQATCPGRRASVCPPIVLGPNAGLSVYVWFPGYSTTAGSIEFEFGWWER